MNNNNGNQLKRIYTLPSGTLSLNDIRRSDAGIYQCIATNSEGSETLEIQLSVIEALTVQILPTQQTVDLGKSTDLVSTANKSIFSQWIRIFGLDFVLKSNIKSLSPTPKLNDHHLVNQNRLDFIKAMHICCQWHNTCA